MANYDRSLMSFIEKDLGPQTSDPRLHIFGEILDEFETIDQFTQAIGRKELLCRSIKPSNIKTHMYISQMDNTSNIMSGFTSNITNHITVDITTGGLNNNISNDDVIDYDIDNYMY